MPRLLFLTIFFLFKSLVSKPALEEFVEIQSNVIQPFSLTKDAPEKYFSYSIKDSSGDTLIRFFKNDGFSIDMYIFKKYEDITDEFENNIQKHSLNDGREFVLKSDSEINTIYIILVSKNSYYHNDFIYILNEKEEIPLENEKMFTINQFLSSKRYNFSFTASKGVNYTIDIVKENKDSKLYFVLKNNDEVPQERQEVKDITTFEVNEKEGKIVVVLEEENETATNGRVNILLSSTQDIKEINSGTEDIHYLISSKKYYYKKKLEGEESSEGAENIIRIDYDFKNSSYIKNKKFSCRIFNTSDFDNNYKLKEEFSNESGDCVAEELLYYDTITFLHYKIPKGIENAENRGLVLLIYVEIEIGTFIATPIRLSTAIGEIHSSSGINLNEIDGKVELELKDFIPMILKVKVPDTQDSESFLFSFNGPHIVTYYQGDILEGEKETLKISSVLNNRELYVFSNKNYLDSPVRQISIVFYGIAMNTTFPIIKLDHEVEYISGARTQKKFIIHNSSNEKKRSFSIFGVYNKYENFVLYYKAIFGNPKVLYKEMVGNSTQILPNDKDEVKSMITLIDNNMDLISSSCSEDCEYQIELLPLVVSKEINPNHEQTFVLIAGQEHNFKLPPMDEKKNYTLVITTVPNSLVTFFNNTVEMPSINASNPYIKEFPGAKEETRLKLTSKTNTIVTILFREADNIYENITENVYGALNKSNIMIKLKQNRKTEINLLNATGEFVYGLYATNSNEEKYFPLFTDLSKNLTLEKEGYLIEISNFKAQNNETNYYLLLSFIENKNLNNTIITFGDFVKLPEETNSFTEIKDGFSFVPTKKTDYYISFLDCKNKLQKISVVEGNKITEKETNNKKVSYIRLQAPTNTINVYPEYSSEINDYESSLAFVQSDSGANETEIENEVEDMNNFKGTLSFDKKSKTFSWDQVTNGEYFLILALKKTENIIKNETQAELFDNPCYLNSLIDYTSKRNLLFDEDKIVVKLNSSYSSYKVEGVEKDFNANILAKTNSKIPMMISYKNIEVNFEEEKEEKEDKFNKLWLILIIGIILLLGVLIVLVICFKRAEDVVSGETVTPKIF